jgi:HEPN domain-containing protein
MKPITSEWVSKAEGDFVMMERESRARRDPNHDGISFHAQQCAEKYLKARPCEGGLESARIHDLVALLEQTLLLIYTSMRISTRAPVGPTRS